MAKFITRWHGPNSFKTFHVNVSTFWTSIIYHSLTVDTPFMYSYTFTIQNYILLDVYTYRINFPQVKLGNFQNPFQWKAKILPTQISGIKNNCLSLCNKYYIFKLLMVELRFTILLQRPIMFIQNICHKKIKMKSQVCFIGNRRIKISNLKHPILPMQRQSTLWNKYSTQYYWNVGFSVLNYVNRNTSQE